MITQRDTTSGKSRLSARKSVENFTIMVWLDVAAVVDGVGSSGETKRPRKTKSTLPPLSCVSEEQAYGVCERCCSTRAKWLSFSACPRGAILRAGNC